MKNQTLWHGAIAFIGLVILAIGGIIIFSIARPKGPTAAATPGKIPANRSAKPATPQSPAAADPLSAARPAIARLVVRDEDFHVLASGSGFFVSPDGLMLTSFHLIQGAPFATVLLPDGSTLFVDGIAAVDQARDAALLQVHGSSPAFLQMADSPPAVGAKVYAASAPPSAGTWNESTVTALAGAGVVAIEVDPPASSDTAGEPMVTADGRAVGIIGSAFTGGVRENVAMTQTQVAQLEKSGGKLATLAGAGGAPLNPQASAVMQQVWDAMTRKDWTQAISTLGTLAPVCRSSPPYWFLAGYLQDKAGQLALEVQAYKQCLKLRPTDADASYNLGNAYDDLRQYADAAAAFEAAVAIDPKFADAYVGLGYARDDLGKIPDAVKAFQAAITLDPKDADAYVGLGYALDHQRKYLDAQSAFKTAISLDSHSADAYVGLGYALDDLEKYPDALAAFKSALAIDAHFAEAHVGLGTLYVHQEKYPEAVEEFKAALAIDPKSALAYIGLGTAYDDQEHYPEAITAFKTALAIDPHEARAYAGLGTTYDDQEKYADAIAAFKQALAIAPTLAEAYVGLGTAFDDQQNYPDAINAFKQALAIAPDDADACTGLGTAYDDQKNFPDALAAFKQALALSPKDAQAYLGMGNLYDDMERRPDAVAAYRRAAALDPKGPIGAEAKKKLQETTAPPNSNPARNPGSTRGAPQPRGRN